MRIASAQTGRTPVLVPLCPLHLPLHMLRGRCSQTSRAQKPLCCKPFGARPCAGHHLWLEHRSPDDTSTHHDRHHCFPASSIWHTRVVDARPWCDIGGVAHIQPILTVGSVTVEKKMRKFPLANRFGARPSTPQYCQRHCGNCIKFNCKPVRGDTKRRSGNW